MQDVHGILGGGGARIFGDRRLRAAAHGHHHQQALKCPRCDSLNTKFCYYNNYNLSQPRYFCKNCRRYWTKGGVLRNVPVGGGCRKSKRSSKRKTSSSPTPPPSSAAKEQHKSNSRSSSESTSVNTINTAGAAKAQSVSCYADVSDAARSGKAMGLATMVSEAGSEYSSCPLLKFSEQPAAATATVTFDNIVPPPPPPPPCGAMSVNFEPLSDHQSAAGISAVDSGAGGGEMFTEIGSFVGLMSGDQHQNLLGFMSPAPLKMHQQNQVNHHYHHHDNQLLVQNLTAQDWQMGKMEGGGLWGPEILDQRVHVDLLQNSRTGDGVPARPDWQGVSGDEGGGGHLGLCDLNPGSGVHHGHWSQSAQWHETDDHHLYLPP